MNQHDPEWFKAFMAWFMGIGLILLIAQFAVIVLGVLWLALSLLFS